ncbi:hypothetical protein KC926_01115 [Candidatus Kaiserbacteria bacterium]|nr:hypothetical protein [Candidatus Kaiserbacteria bacterium]
MKKILMALLLVVFIMPATSDAYVSVNGYFRADGTYVAPYVRSNPNGLKYDNYGWTPSQGLYNPTYGTRGAAWDTPTWITDPYYYEGKSLYESNHASVGSINTYSAPTLPSYTYPSGATKSHTKSSVSVPKNASLNYSGTDWYCDTGYKTKYDDNYKKVGCTKIKVPTNAHLSTFSNDWYCDTGYRTTYNNSYQKSGCEEIEVPSHAHLSTFSNDWYCDSGYETKYNDNYEKVGCTKIKIPKNAHLSTFSNDWYCDSGYETKYDSNYKKVGCVKE